MFRCTDTFGPGRKARLAALLALALISWPCASETLTIAADQAPEAARMIAEVVRAGRNIVARHQVLINDPDRQHKGFTAAYFRDQLRAEFQRTTGRLPEAIGQPGVRALLEATVDAATQAVERSQTMIDAPDRAFKGFIPAYFGRLTGQILLAATGISIKQPTFSPRNSYNQPDAFELQMLEQFRKAMPADGNGTRVGRHYRYMAPIYIEAACLQCHGEPRGALDLTGREMEGYKLGDLRGALSIDLPLAD